MNEATMAWATAHRHDDVGRLALAAAPEAEVDLKQALQQIEGWQTARKKLPSWAACDSLIYPPRLSMEQCSSEQTALYKLQQAERVLKADSRLKATKPFGHFADLTGGFGVDFATIATLFGNAEYIEQQQDLCRIAAHNFEALSLSQAHVVCGDGMARVLAAEEVYDMILIDPARRGNAGQRTYALCDCTPDITPHVSQLLDRCRWLMLKLSPMLDWRKAVADVGSENVREVHIVAVGGECKELLLMLSSAPAEAPLRLLCSNDGRQTELDPTLTHVPIAGEPACGQMLFEPDAAIMKSGCFASICSKYHLEAVAANSHLFILQSNRHCEEPLPGRLFAIDRVCSMNKKELRRTLADISQANITTRNFPLTPQQLRQRLSLRDGGNIFIFATTTANGHHILMITHKAQS